MDNEISSQNKDTEHISHNSREQNEDNYDLQPQEQTIDRDLTQSRIKNENNEYNDHSPSCVNEPVSSEEINGFQNVDVNTPGKTINITLNESTCNDSNGLNPVAKIEILSNILISGDSGMTITGQDQLPQSYSEAIENLNNEDMSINHTTNVPLDRPAATQMDISEISNDGDDIPMSKNTSESGLQDCDNSATRNTLIQIFNLDNREQLRDLVQQDSILYTSSNRGALQLILNRFMYYCHYQRDNGRKRRWRCINYRDAHCPASIDTVGDEIVERKHIHCHPNHDEKIRKKMSRSNIKCFPSIEVAEAFTKQQGSDA